MQGQGLSSNPERQIGHFREGWIEIIRVLGAKYYAYLALLNLTKVPPSLTSGDPLPELAILEMWNKMSLQIFGTLVLDRSALSIRLSAPAPFSPIDKAIATSNLLAHICTQKFDDHSPLYRQERIWQRLGVSLSRATMANWILSCGTKLMPIIDLLKHDINKANYVCSDETTINVLSNNKSTNYM